MAESAAIVAQLKDILTGIDGDLTLLPDAFAERNRDFLFLARNWAFLTSSAYVRSAAKLNRVLRVEIRSGGHVKLSALVEHRDNWLHELDRMSKAGGPSFTPLPGGDPRRTRFSGGLQAFTRNRDFLSRFLIACVRQSHPAQPDEAGTRNPAWQRDELILALDLYFRHNPAHIGKSHPEVVALSELLNRLPIHKNRPDEERFRNANGVYMKLCNFLRFDLTYQGSGLTRGNAEEQEVWEEFAGDHDRLSKIAAAIGSRVSQRPAAEEIAETFDEEDEFPEGKVLFRAHRSRERHPALAKRAKEVALKKYGVLTCQACAFDFSAIYGELGNGYIECHHVVPISDLSPGAKTKVADLALLCSNCHRMVHRRRPWLSITQLKSLVEPS